MKQTPLKRKSTIKRGQPKRDWEAARAKVDREGQCRAWTGNLDDTGCEGPLEAAHLTGRAADAYPEWILAAGEHKEYEVAPDRVIPLCRKHHRAFDAHELDVLSVVHLWEQLQVVIDLNGIENARRRLAPSLYRRES